jgi:hypothetical protein
MARAGKFSPQFDFVASPSLTLGKGDGTKLPLNTFNDNSLSGVSVDYKSSITLGTNVVVNSEGRNQGVGFIGLKSGDVSLNGYNDLFKFVGGDGDDRWSTGGISLNVKAGNIGVATFATSVFTGERLGKDDKGNWRSATGNPSGGKYGTYEQTTKNQLLNNGQSRIILSGVNGLYLDGGVTGGRNHMYSQNSIHNNLSKNLLFHSTATGL